MKDLQYKKKLKDALEYAKNQEIGETINLLKMDLFCKDFFPKTKWAIGPFSKADIIYKKNIKLNDPTNIGWTSSYIFNPSLLVEGENIYIYYRAGVKKESMGSRIGLTIYNEKEGFNELKDPIIYPTDEDEYLSIDDPKVYKYEDGYIMFYNAVYYAEEEIKKYNKNKKDVCVNIKYALSKDKIHWEKKGLVVPKEISKLWAKGAVILRNANGEALRINGKYLMFLSEGCGGFQYIGYSNNMIDWEFKQQTYLTLPKEYGRQILEVACAIDLKDKFILDFFYYDNNNEFQAAQALYSKSNPTVMIDIHKGGSLSWGGMSQYKDNWIFAQGWDSPLFIEELYFYTCPIKGN